ncbi:hypothetical protein [Succinimonas sp.]|uniref:hypothetical protein n=2 Tax=Succinimonas sp. TaxID=1936151 RepID=UPI003869F382
MSDNANHNAGDGGEFTREELREALPYFRGRISFGGGEDSSAAGIMHGHPGFHRMGDDADVGESSPPACPYCHEPIAGGHIGFPFFEKFPKAVFVRCDHCHRVYFRQDAQEPALIKSPMYRSLKNYLLVAVALPAVFFLAGFGIFGSEGRPEPVIMLALFAALLAVLMGWGIRDKGTTAEEIRASQKRLESTVYLAALRDRGIELPEHYLRRLENNGAAPEGSNQPAPGP